MEFPTARLLTEFAAAAALAAVVFALVRAQSLRGSKLEPAAPTADAPVRGRVDPVVGTLPDVEIRPSDSSFLIDENDFAAAFNMDDADKTAELPASLKVRADDAGDQEPRTDATLETDFLDLDATVQHVQLPSLLHEATGFKERRTSLADVLKKAIEREPHRTDLRMKLLETYYTAAAANRQAFLEIVGKLGPERGDLPNGEWAKIAAMGRHIAADSTLFEIDSAPADGDDVAHCA